MITIAGAPYQVGQDQFPANSVERQLLEQISNSEETYRFDTQEQLHFELSLRSNIVSASRALARSGLRFAVFHKSQCNADYWSRTSNGGFRLNSGVAPSAAIRDIFQNGRKYATECATAMVIVYYGALLEQLPEDTFNRLFPTIYLMNWHELDPLLRDVGTPRRVADILLGDRCYFNNPDVDPKTPELQGENVIVLPGGLYYGHGIGIVTGEQVLRMLNANRRPGATRQAYFMEGMAARPNFKRLEEAAQNEPVRPTVLQWNPFPSPARG